MMEAVPFEASGNHHSFFSPTEQLNLRLLEDFLLEGCTGTVLQPCFFSFVLFVHSVCAVLSWLVHDQ